MDVIQKELMCEGHESHMFIALQKSQSALSWPGLYTSSIQPTFGAMQSLRTTLHLKSIFMTVSLNNTKQVSAFIFHFVFHLQKISGTTNQRESGW